MTTRGRLFLPIPYNLFDWIPRGSMLWARRTRWSKHNYLAWIDIANVAPAESEERREIRLTLSARLLLSEFPSQLLADRLPRRQRKTGHLSTKQLMSIYDLIVIILFCYFAFQMNWSLMVRQALLTWFTLMQISGTIPSIMTNAWNLFAKGDLFYSMM